MIKEKPQQVEKPKEKTFENNSPKKEESKKNDAKKSVGCPPALSDLFVCRMFRFVAGWIDRLCAVSRNWRR